MKKEERIVRGKKLYVVNICQNRGMLHINDGRCWYVRMVFDSKDFDNEASAFRAFDNNLKKCRICFREELEGNY